MTLKKLSVSLIVWFILACGSPIRIGVNTEPLVTTYAPQVMTVCDSGGLNVRACPSTECKIVDWLEDGDTVTVHSQSIRWNAVDGGWVRNRYLCKNT